MVNSRWNYEAHEPFWGASTSRANFCEEDYAVTPYVAEFVNSLSSLAYAFLAYYGYRRLPPGSNSLTYVALVFVGLASALFHATLKKHTQFMDDSSMVIGSGVTLHRVLTIGRSHNYTVKLATVLLVVNTAVLAFHMKTNDRVTLELAFGGMIAGVCYGCVRRIGATAKDHPSRGINKALAWGGGAAFISGYVMWQIDHLFCVQLNQLRHSVGMPLGFLTETHGWWHILTAVGVFSYIFLVERVRFEAGSTGHKTKRRN